MPRKSQFPDLLIFGSFLVILFCGCARPWSSNSPISLPLPTSTRPQPTEEAILTILLPATELPPTVPPTHRPVAQIWIDPLISPAQRERLKVFGALINDPSANGNLRVSIGTGSLQIGWWVFALAAPFPTMTDGISLGELKSAWQGNGGGSMNGRSLLVDGAVRQVLERSWGAAGKGVRTVEASQLLDMAWAEKTNWAIVPFEILQPRWKVLKLDGRSPYDRSFDPASYGLALPVSVDGDTQAMKLAQPNFEQFKANPITNRDGRRLTVVLMTGVSALVRGTAWYMEQKGILYPVRDIRAWLHDADFTHVSNEVSFNPKCAPPDPNDPNLRFCSLPKYIQLFEDARVNVVEMTGNHLNDFGSEWVGYSLEMYRQRNWLAYGAGLNQDAARKAVTVNHNGNRLAFIGCNPVGPKGDWATASQAGTADCGYPDMSYLEAEIKRFSSLGYLTIVTIQYFESYDPTPLPAHYRDFRRLSDAGAVIVSGSQAHLPQAMELRNHGFIHYGLGNLFFDQMDTPWRDTKDEFLDRHVFYEGRYMGVDLLTAQLEDYVKPRPMTAKEREAELSAIFAVSGWPQSGEKEWSKGK